MSCVSCGSISFRIEDECYIICNDCGEQCGEISQTNEYETDAKRFGGTLVDAEDPIKTNGSGNQVFTDVSLPFEAPSKTSMGSTSIDDPNVRREQQELSKKRQIRFVMQQLVQPLCGFGFNDQRVFSCVERMLNELYLYHSGDELNEDDHDHDHDHDNGNGNNNGPTKTKMKMDDPDSSDESDNDDNDSSDEDGDDNYDNPDNSTPVKKRKIQRGLKNRGLRKKAIFIYIVKRIILHFLPQYDENRYDHEVVIPYCCNVKLAKIQKYIQEYGIPVFRKYFSAFDSHYEDDQERHIICEVFRVLHCIHKKGVYSEVFVKNPELTEIFNATVLILFNPIVESYLQSWDFSTRLGVIACHLGYTNPEEIVQFMQECEMQTVKPPTIKSKLRTPILLTLFENIRKNSSHWDSVFTSFFSKI